MKVLIAGCGYVGTALGAELVKAGHEVWGLRRDLDAARALEAHGIKPIVANLLRADTLKTLPSVDTVVLCQAPSKKSDEYKDVYFNGTRTLLSVLPEKSIRKIILISSTSVYATTDGSWVDEETDPMAGSHGDAESRENAKTLLAQEDLVMHSGHPAMVLRLAGIYGPARNRVRPILEGKIKPVLTETYMNRIHLHDIVRTIRLLLDKGSPGQTYLGSDDAPSTQREFYTWIFEKLSLSLPAASAQVEGGAPHGSNKRCSNRKLKALGLQLRYPSYKEGYQPVIQDILTDAVRRGSISSGNWISR